MEGSDVKKEELEALVKKHVDALGEHCETVQVFVTMPHPDDPHVTRSYEFGCGNWFARYGQIVEYMHIQEEHQRIWAREFKKEEPE